MGKLTVVLGYLSRLSEAELTNPRDMKPGDFNEQRFAYICLRFCNAALALPGFTGRVKQSVTEFQGIFGKNLKSFETKDLDDLPDIEGATKKAWAGLGHIQYTKVTSKYWKNLEEYRSYLLVRAFMDGARRMSTRMGATVPDGVEGVWNKMFQLTREIGTTDMERETADAYRDVVDIFSMDTSNLRLKPKSNPEDWESLVKEYKPGEKPDQGKVEPPEPEKKPEEPSKPTITKNVAEAVKDLSKAKGLNTVIKRMPADKQDTLKKILDEIQDLMTEPVPATRSASLGSAFAELVEYIRPYNGQFIKELRHNPISGIPADERVWSDPSRLQDLLGSMPMDRGLAALKKTEEILGIINSMS